MTSEPPAGEGGPTPGQGPAPARPHPSAASPYQPGTSPYDQAYPPAQAQQPSGYPPQQPGYPQPEQQPGYPQPGYPQPQQPGYPSQQQPPGYPQQQPGYPSAAPQQGYPDQQSPYAAQQASPYAPPQGGAAQSPYQPSPDAGGGAYGGPAAPSQRSGYPGGPPSGGPGAGDPGGSRGLGGPGAQGRPGSFDGPLPDAPADTPPLQWGQPLSSSAPAPRSKGPKPLSKLAVVSLVLGFLGGGLGLILGLVALLRIRRTGKRGAPLAVGGIVLAVAWAALVGYVYVAVINAPQARDTPGGPVVRRGEVLVTDLRVGDCIEKWAVSNSIGKVTVVPCTFNHDAEIFHTFTAGGAGAFPGDKAVTDEANTQCTTKAKTGLKPDDLKTAKIAFLKPVQASWDKNEKQVTCVATTPAPLGRSIRK